MNKTIDIIWIIFWLIVLVLSLTNMMMVAMDLMAVGMLAEAAICYYRDRQKINK